jgi:hypothetical protein
MLRKALKEGVVVVAQMNRRDVNGFTVKATTKLAGALIWGARRGEPWLIQLQPGR